MDCTGLPGDHILKAHADKSCTFIGTFWFAQDKDLCLEHLTCWHSSMSQVLKHSRVDSAIRNDWVLTSNRQGITVTESHESERPLWSSIIVWICYIMEEVLPKLDLKLEGQVAYEGANPVETTGRLYIDASGHLAQQPIEDFSGVIGAVTSKNMPALQQLSLHQLQEVDLFGRSAVMLAAMFSNYPALTYLLQHSSCINWQQKDHQLGMCPLHFIVSETPTEESSKQYSQMLSLLPDSLPHSIINATDNAWAPLHLAVCHENKLMFEWLIKHGADIDHGNTYEKNDHWQHPLLPLQAALQHPDIWYTRYLLESGARLFARSTGAVLVAADAADYTTVPIPLTVYRADKISLLVQYGADLRSIRFCKLLSHVDVVQALLHQPQWSESCEKVITATNQGLKPRRQLVVMILVRQRQPQLTADLIHLICELADLLPYKMPAQRHSQLPCM